MIMLYCVAEAEHNVHNAEKNRHEQFAAVYTFFEHMRHCHKFPKICKRAHAVCHGFKLKLPVVNEY